jgi:superfamily II DNA or RNA helicase
MELPTGTGKSLMFGLMARWLNLTMKKKVAVVVPNEVLAAIQSLKYSPWAAKDITELFNPASACISYCTYKEALTGGIPHGTVLLVDEIDAFIFSEKPAVAGNKLLSSILLLNQYKTIGMTATFRGERGKNSMLELL